MPSVLAADFKKPYSVGPSACEIANDIKAKVTIPDLATKLYPGWAPEKSCRCPWRDDKNASFSVYLDGTRWKDHGTGEGGDVFDFFERATGCTKSAAFLALKEMEDGSEATPTIRVPGMPEERKEQYHPRLLTPTAADLDAISNLRSISAEGLKLAVDRGFLFTAFLKGVRAFVITDQTRRNYLARRLDGKPWKHTGSKACSLPGSSASWPIGAQEAADYPAVALCEGGPDFLAAFGHAYASDVENLVAPVCLSSAAVRIPPDALPFFKEKRVRIFVHDDSAGGYGAKRWAAQLSGVASKIDGFLFDGLIMDSGLPVTDLNDLLKIDYDCWEENRETVEGVMSFALEEGAL